VLAVKRHNFTQRFDLQGHARVQIFTYKDVSVCNVSSPNFHMFYDQRRVSTQIFRGFSMTVNCNVLAVNFVNITDVLGVNWIYFCIFFLFATMTHNSSLTLFTKTDLSVPS